MVDHIAVQRGIAGSIEPLDLLADARRADRRWRKEGGGTIAALTQTEFLGCDAVPEGLGLRRGYRCEWVSHEATLPIGPTATTTSLGVSQRRLLARSDVTGRVVHAP